MKRLQCWGKAVFRCLSHLQDTPSSSWANSLLCCTNASAACPALSWHHFWQYPFPGSFKMDSRFASVADKQQGADLRYSTTYSKYAAKQLKMLTFPNGSYSAAWRRRATLVCFTHSTSFSPPTTSKAAKQFFPDAAKSLGVSTGKERERETNSSYHFTVNKFSWLSKLVEVWIQHLGSTSHASCVTLPAPLTPSTQKEAEQYWR